MNVDESKDKDIYTKENALNWLLAFIRATKYYIHYKDRKKYEKIDERKDEEKGEKNDKEKDEDLKNLIDVASDIKIIDHESIHEVTYYNVDKYLDPDSKKIPLPIVISSYLSSYLKIISEHDLKKADEKIIDLLHENLVKIIDCFSNLEKFLRFPQPLAYSIYMSQTVWIYCLAFPFQLVTTSGWFTIPITFFMTFILFGAHKIGLRAECPFEYEEDLGVECVCK
jgi:putative membrane protein